MLLLLLKSLGHDGINCALNKTECNGNSFNECLCQLTNVPRGLYNLVPLSKCSAGSGCL